MADPDAWRFLSGEPKGTGKTKVSHLAEWSGHPGIRSHDCEDWNWKLYFCRSTKAIYQVLWGFKLNTVEVARAFEGADVVPHSSRFAVVDPAGRVRAQPAGEETSADEIVSMLKRVLIKP